ncbi:hypothetical protein KDL01_02290 [Actinospica durhamensis]|uniref:Uncharacterized protein n=1 Tax=Actinospica durhamensis TaxID=1508375 RepID=A0A941EKK8_9ACTN|nr:hypothetical protein [Actinospica durhamensis]MBR7832068.1 hypothetical protein [Actinospica durhamensis]
MLLHAMHSVSDTLAFAVWKQGELVRSLSLSPHGGITENIGEPLPFEKPFWAGEHAVSPVPGKLSKGPYPLPFHPLTLGEAALRALFGFVVEGRHAPDDVDGSAITIHGFVLTDPSGPTIEQRRAARAAAATLMGPRRSLYLQPDGSWAEAFTSPEATTA